jgi:hypothetical protein
LVFGVTGWNDASETFNVTLELVRRCYTEGQIEKFRGGNLLSVMDESSASRRKNESNFAFHSGLRPRNADIHRAVDY